MRTIPAAENRGVRPKGTISEDMFTLGLCLAILDADRSILCEVLQVV